MFELDVLTTVVITEIGVQYAVFVGSIEALLVWVRIQRYHAPL